MSTTRPTRWRRRRTFVLAPVASSTLQSRRPDRSAMLDGRPEKVNVRVSRGKLCVCRAIALRPASTPTHDFREINP